MKSPDEFGEQLEAFDLLIIASAEKLTDTEVLILLDACQVHRVPTALFLPSGSRILGTIKEMAAQEFYVGIPKDKQSFLIKDMVTAEIKRYRFFEEGRLEISGVTEKEFAQECPKEHY